MRIKITMLISIMCLFIIGSCNSNSSNEVKEEMMGGIEYKTLGTDPVIIIHDLLDAGMDMAVKGTLKYDNNSNCLFLYNDIEDIMITPVWPEGTTAYFDNNLYGVQIPDYGIIMEGDDISTSGGGIEHSEIADLNFPSECLDKEFIILITPNI